MKRTMEVKPYCIYKGEPVYDKKALCLLFKCSERTIENYVDDGLLQPRKIGLGRLSVGFFERDVDAFINRRK